MPMPSHAHLNLNFNLSPLCREGWLKETLQTLLTTHGFPLDSSTYSQLLQTCIAKNAISQGKQIHSFIIQRGFAFATETKFQNNLINMYVKCGSLVDARQVFDDMKERDCFSWNTIIAAYRRNGYANQALLLFQQMQRTATQPDQFTFASILEACADTKALYQGIGVHQSIMERGLLSDVVVGSALVDMYAKCGKVHSARELFDKMPQRNVVSWTAMVTGYAQNGALDEALRLFKQMPQRDAVSWTAMVSGYAQNGLGEKALETFKEMQLVGIQPDQFTFASILPTCAKMGALEQGIEIHQSTIESGFLSDVVVVSALVDMYAKCGSIQKARKLFDNMNQRDAVSWNAIIAGYAFHGFHMDAFQLFELMKLSGACPDRISFICVLFACSHAGLVDEGCKYFNDMINSHCFIPTIDHYVCIVDLVGRVGYLEEALNFIIKMPVKPVAVVWICMLGACRSHNNVGLGVFAATCLFEMDPKSAAPYVLLSNIYAEGGRWIEVQKVRRLMKDRGIKKTLGCSWIEIHKIVHVFFVESGSHPQTHEIYGKLDKLST